MIMQITIALDSGSPPFEQIREQIAGLVAAGHLCPGDRLPTVRDLAADLGVAVGTVRRAYSELEGQGVVSSRPRHGTVVTAESHESRVAIRRAVRDLVRQAREAGLSDNEILDVVRGSLT
ncbi:GntR family transcriptional regulator [Bogoriella caseilytica]|uniref:GntR family transcriptional regulator n=1 Tax=Bogoriella caseilytica TaxID=56055 RepID=A0A3N2BE52_9MICO|nr:GntR family transcriptional regulator [Bogoriella caseilytica]ROR73505.1 GntR family transcriptional regulator [Bogoriella caseilytica]